MTYDGAEDEGFHARRDSVWREGCTGLFHLVAPLVGTAGEHEGKLYCGDPKLPGVLTRYGTEGTWCTVCVMRSAAKAIAWGYAAEWHMDLLRVAADQVGANSCS